MERITRFRAIVLLSIFIIIVGFFAVRLYDLQLVEAEGQVGADNFVIYTRVKAARGDLLDCDGNALVSNRASYDLVFNPYVITDSEDPNGSLLKLIKLCQERGVEYIDHFPVTKERPFEYTLDEYSSSWQGYFQSFLVARGNLDSDITAPLLMQKLRSSYYIPEDWSDEDARLVIGLRYELTLRHVVNMDNYRFIEDVQDEDLAAILELNTPGLTTEASTVREYSTNIAAHILGFTGAMNKDQWEYYKNIDGYEMDSVVGQEGFEAAFEEWLHGTDGLRKDVVASDGTVISTEWITEPKAGMNVEVTLDIGLQRVAEEATAQTMEALRAQEDDADGKDAEGCAVVAMEVKTGKILACVSYPSYNLETFRDEWDTLVNDPLKPLYNRALLATYPPGSTYKMSMVVAGIDSGTIGAYTTIYDEGVFTKYDGEDGPTCLAWSISGGSHGDTDSMEALSKSCNYYFYVLGDMIDLEAMDSTAKALGLGESTGVELPEETGWRANAETKARLYNGTDALWYRGDQVLAAIGQSDNRFTPLQLCVYTATLANQGRRYQATFLNRVVSTDYRTLIEDNQPTIISTMPFSDDAYMAVVTGMEMVTTEGTAATVFSGFPISVAGKTGTAETGKYGVSDNGAFVCFAPADDPQIAIAIYGEQAGHGSSLAAIARTMLEYYFDIDEVSEVNSYENQIG